MCKDLVCVVDANNTVTVMMLRANLRWKQVPPRVIETKVSDMESKFRNRACFKCRCHFIRSRGPFDGSRCLRYRLLNVLPPYTINFLSPWKRHYNLRCCSCFRLSDFRPRRSFLWKNNPFVSFFPLCTIFFPLRYVVLSWRSSPPLSPCTFGWDYDVINGVVGWLSDASFIT